MSEQRVAVIGAGWAGLAAAVQATDAGHKVTLIEAARTLGGRARALPATLPNGQSVVLDNGQHILIGAYSATLALMCQVGVQPDQVLQRMPLRLQFPDGSGLRLPNWPAPLDALAGILGARGWSWGDKLGLLRVTAAWRRAGFVCDPEITVAQLGEQLSARVRATLLEPLCVSALNTPADQASGQVFLRVIQDSLFAGNGGSNFLLATTDIGSLLPDAAALWLRQRGATLTLGQRVEKLDHGASGWQVDGAAFDQVVLACPPWEAARLAATLAPEWAAQTQTLQFEAIATVYAYAAGARLSQPLLALHSSPDAPAQFVFDRGQLGAQKGLLAFVISASRGERETLQKQVLDQARSQLGLAQITAVQTVVEKRATFACTPGLQRPPLAIGPGLWACGDYVTGPYPATLEGAVRSGAAAAQAL